MKTRETGEERRDRERERRARCSQAVKMMRRRGLAPDRCEQCWQAGAVDGHHDDHDQPGQIEWLCRLCHAHAESNLGMEDHVLVNLFGDAGREVVAELHEDDRAYSSASWPD